MTAKRRFFKITTAVIAFVCAFTLFGACSSGDGLPPVSAANKTPILDLRASQLYMDLYDELPLDPKTENLTGKIIWSSSDDSVVSVDGKGVLTSFGKSGSATVSAKSSGISASLKVDVRAEGIPALLLSDESVTLNGVFPQTGYTVRPSLLYNGKDVTADYEVKWSEIGHADVAEMSVKSGGAAAFTPKNNGVANFRAYVDFNGTAVFDTVRVNVVTLDTVLIVNGTLPSAEGYRVHLSTYGQTAYAKPAVTAYDLAYGRNENLSVVWECVSGDGSCVRDEGDEWIADKSGFVRYRGDCGAYGEIFLDIDVTVPVYDVLTSKPYIFEIQSTQEQNFDIAQISFDGTPEPNIIGDLQHVWYDGKDVLESADAATFSLDGTKFANEAAKLGKQTLLLETDKVQYKVPVTLYSLIITDAEQLASVAEAARVTRGGELYDGYYLLGSDIENYTGMEILGTVSTSNLSKGFELGFCGIFDGQGYSVSGANVPAGYHALMGTCLNAKGIVRNLSITDLTLNADASIKYQGEAAMFVSVFGTMENIYVQVTETNGALDGGGLCATWQSGAAAKIARCFLDYSQAGEMNLPRYYPNSKQNFCTDVYSVVKGVYNASDKGKRFESYADIKADNAAQNAFKKWETETEFWAYDSAKGIPVPRNLRDQ